MKVASPFAYEGELILVEAELRGPRGTALRRLVLDTGAAATTLLPEVLDELGYSARDGDKRTKVHSAIVVEVKLRGPRSESVRNLVLDTGAAATTLIPEVIDDLGYSARDGNKLSRVHSAIAEEHRLLAAVTVLHAVTRSGSNRRQRVSSSMGAGTT